MERGIDMTTYANGEQWRGAPPPTGPPQYVEPPTQYVRPPVPVDIVSSQRPASKIADNVANFVVLPPETTERFSPHSMIVALLLWWWVGYLGIHRMYLGLWGSGLLMLAFWPGIIPVAMLDAAWMPNAQYPWILLAYVAFFGLWWLLEPFRLLLGELTDHSGLPLRPLL